VAGGNSGAILTIHSGAGPRSGAILRVLITGAGGGIGYACAGAFAERGAELILSDIDGRALKLASSHLGALGRFCDVASEASVAIFTADVLKSFSTIDVLINAAGRGYVRNLGTMRITRAFLPMMRSDGAKKHIVNIASMGNAVRGGCHFPYAASQEAFDRLSDALAENVRGTSIALTTVVPSMCLGTPEQDGPATNVSVEALESYDAEQVAAAVVEAVHSTRTIAGRINLLAGQALARTSGPEPVADHCRASRKLGI
jgi:NAD(P)-dependent dehydrogenase (short-subunit alcohol dehydrogenase family)